MRRRSPAWQAAISRFMLGQDAQRLDPDRLDHTVQITSFGGCGTTALYEYLGAAGCNIPKTFGHFPFKHQRTPPDPATVPPGFRAVYLYGDPRNAVLSIFRREAQFGHYRGMRLADPPAAAKRRLASVEAFLDAGVDEFQLEDHFDQWWGHGRDSVPVLFVEYEHLANVWPTVRDFVGLPADYPCLDWQPRSSDWQTLPAVQRSQLDTMYGRLVERISSLPPVVVRGDARV
jgi:hypothetical protein